MHLSLPNPLAKPIYIGHLGLVHDRRRQVGSRLPPRRRRGCRRWARRCYLECSQQPLARRLMELPSPVGRQRRLRSLVQLRPKEHHSVRPMKMHATTAKIHNICYLRLRTRPRPGMLFPLSIIPCYCHPRFHAFVQALLPYISCIICARDLLQITANNWNATDEYVEQMIDGSCMSIARGVRREKNVLRPIELTWVKSRLVT